MLATASLVGFYPLPYGIVTSATYRDYPGTMITAAYQAPNSVTTYGPAWQRPTLLQGARFLKISGQLDF